MAPNKQYITPEVNKEQSLVDLTKLSSLQNHLILLQRLTPNSAAYTKCCAVYGIFNEMNLKQLFTRVLKTFPLLASVIVKLDSEQEMLSQLSIEEIVESCIGPVIEVDTLQEAKYKAFELTPSFDMRCKTPLVKFQMFRIHNDKTANELIVIFTHQVLVDEPSVALIENALLAFLKKEPFVCQKPLKNYIDFVHEELAYLSSSKKKNDLQSLSENFTAKEAYNCLGFSAETWCESKIYAAKHLATVIDLDISSFIESCCVNAFEFYLCCFLLSLRRYVAENVILVNVPIDIRSHPYENTFGPLFNVVLFQYIFTTNHNLQTFIADVVTQWAKFKAKYLLSSNEVFSYLKQKKKIAQLKRFNCFEYTSITKNENTLEIETKHAKYPLHLHIREIANAKIEIRVDWAVELIDECIVKNFTASFINACQKIAQNFNHIKKQPISSFDVMTSEEYFRIMSVNRKMSPKPNTFMHRFFEKHCENSGDKLALICENRKYTYLQLNETAIKIAAYLQSVIPEQDLQKKPIVIMMNRDEMVIASILAVWKIGGFFLPISDDMHQRLLQIESDPACEVDFVLINFDQSTLGVDVPENMKLIDVRTIVSNASEVFEDRLAGKEPENTAAYVILTSGTTGEPKKCQITHKNLSILTLALLHDLKLDELEMNVLQWVQISFDSSIHDYIVSLFAVPGTMTVIPRQHRFDLDKFEQLCAENKISSILITPLFASSFLSELSSEALNHMRLVFIVGDAFYLNVYEKLKSKLNANAKIVNSYGLSETTIASLIFDENVRYVTSSGVVPIGKPMLGIEACIVDPATKMLSPIGTIGEICICGDVVGRGDVKRTTLDFTSDKPVFMTGDKGRLLPDGNIDFLGRMDTSFIKVYGFRVNPLEIEHSVNRFMGDKLYDVRVFVAENRGKQKVICLAYKPRIIGANLDNEI
ncbi:hypothetical protein B4U79_16905, partial [Dinothrombium tinctorium]